MPYKDLLKRKAYHKAYSARNYRENKEKLLNQINSYKASKPWITMLVSINSRIKQENKQGTSKYYHDKGIRNYLTLDNLEYLWFRDGADRMDKPSIHRKNSEKDYTLKNCEYVEHVKHSKIHQPTQDKRSGKWVNQNTAIKI